MISKIIKALIVIAFSNISAFAQSVSIVVPTSHNGPILSIVIDTQNKYFYTADDLKIIMWDLKTVKQLYSFNIANKSSGKDQFDNTIHNFKNLTISPDGNILALTTGKDSLKIYSTTTGKILQTIPNVSSNIVFSTNSKTIYDLVRGPKALNSFDNPGRMVRNIDIATGTVRDYWDLKDLNIWGVYANYFFPLADSRIVNFTERGYQILELDNKKEIASHQITEEAKKKFLEPNSPFNQNNFKVYPESGLAVFQQNRKDGLGWATWDLYANKEFAFMPAYAVINMQQSFSQQNILYITRGTRYDKQELVVYSKGYKIEKKKLLNITDEMRIATLSKKKNTIIYSDYNNNLYTANLDNNEKQMVAKGLPNINLSSFYRDGNMMSFNASVIVSDNVNQGTFETYRSDYVVDLSRAALYAHDTVPSIPANIVSSIRLSKDSFLLDYSSMETDKHKFIIYDKKNKKQEPFLIKDFYVSNNVSSRTFGGLPDLFTLSTPGVAYYSTGSDAVKPTDRYTYNLYKYNSATKKSEKIFTAFEMLPEKWESLGGGRERPFTNQQLIIDKESEILAAAENDFKGSIRIIDIKTGKVLARHPFAYDSATLKNNPNKQTWQLQGNNYRPFIIYQVKRINENLVSVLGSEKIYDFNLTDGSVKEKQIIDGSMFDKKNDVNVFADHKLKTVLTTYADGNETVVKVVYGTNLYKLDHISSPVKHIEFTQNDSVLYTINDDKSMNVYNAITGKFYGTLYIFENSTDWVFVGADGRFDGTDKGMSRLYYLKGREVVNLDKVYEKYFTPNLFKRLVNGEMFEPVPDIYFKPKPNTKMIYAEKQRNLEVDEDIPGYNNTTGIAEITVNATAPEDKVDEIRLFHNGKVLTLATRGMFVTDNDGTDTKKYTVNLLPGVNNFRSVALNSQRTESDADEITVTYGPAGGIPAPAPKPVNGVVPVKIDAVDRNATLHLVIVGINQYQNPKMSLNYALADATAFKAEMEKDAKSVLGNVKTYFVTDANANTDGIKNAFKQVQATAKASDVFVFYYAGHGVVSNKNKEFYLVPTNVSNLSNVDAELAEKGITSKALQQYAIDIAAQKQVFILDACQSAGAFEQMLQQSGDQQKSLALIARSTGTHWLAASGSQQYANEFSQLGHGAFTYVLLNALKGEAAADKMITIYGLRNFLQNKVPELLKKYGGTPQYPASYGVGNDFPVEMIK